MKITLQDAWGLASDRRFDNLDMPILHDPVNYGAKADIGSHYGEFLSLSTDLPRSAGAFTQFLAGEKSEVSELPFEQRISAVLRYLSSPMRFEPLNSPEVHYPVSSFGGLLSCGIKFVCRHPEKNGYAEVFHFYGNYHALEKQHACVEWPDALPIGEWLVVITGQYWTVGRKYGDFSPFGVVLDSGIILAQLQYLLNLFGIGFSTGNLDLNRIGERVIPTGSFQQVLAALPISVPDEAATMLNGSLKPMEIAAYQEPKGITERFSLLNDTVDLLSASYEKHWPESPENAETESDAQLLQSLPDTDILDVIYNRTSSSDRLGFSQINKMLDGEFLQRFMKTFHKLRSRRALLPLEDKLMLNLAWINNFGPSMGLYNDQAEPIYIAQDTKQFRNILQDRLYSTNQKYNIASMTLEMYISVDTYQVSEFAGNSAFRLAHMAAGAVAHDMCLVASLFGAFARPVRMFRDTKLQQRLGLDGQLLMQVLVGFNRYNNYALTIL
ncbi:hypothetical protein [Alteromonas sp. a30]|uniref:hypothetical protein n=1 Tax=Alteromonas sp. a30 TaxID=2730917 RepID=UPI002283101C|nr:hypothetical protein [Alteromonas sp. a30]MCY7294750.1 hypothetical protein [Alteromonas sp. a30]